MAAKGTVVDIGVVWAAAVGFAVADSPDSRMLLEEVVLYHASYDTVPPQSRWAICQKPKYSTR